MSKIKRFREESEELVVQYEWPLDRETWEIIVDHIAEMTHEGYAGFLMILHDKRAEYLEKYPEPKYEEEEDETK
jgi:hypothetical protein